MTAYNSVQYAAIATLGTLGDGRDHNAKVKIFPFNWTVPTTPGAAPTVNLTKVPAGFKPKGFFFASDAMSATVTAGLNIRVGDAGDDDRLMADLDCDGAVTGSSAIDWLAAAAQNYEYTAETDIVATVTAGKTPVAAATLYGFIMGTVEG